MPYLPARHRTASRPQPQPHLAARGPASSSDGGASQTAIDAIIVVGVVVATALLAFLLFRYAHLLKRRPHFGPEPRLDLREGEPRAEMEREREREEEGRRIRWEPQVQVRTQAEGGTPSMVERSESRVMVGRAGPSQSQGDLSRSKTLPRKPQPNHEPPTSNSSGANSVLDIRAPSIATTISRQALDGSSKSTTSHTHAQSQTQSQSPSQGSGSRRTSRTSTLANFGSSNAHDPLEVPVPPLPVSSPPPPPKPVSAPGTASRTARPEIPGSAAAAEAGPSRQGSTERPAALRIDTAFPVPAGPRASASTNTNTTVTGRPRADSRDDVRWTPQTGRNTGTPAVENAKAGPWAAAYMTRAPLVLPSATDTVKALPSAPLERERSSEHGRREGSATRDRSGSRSGPSPSPHVWNARPVLNLPPGSESSGRSITSNEARIDPYVLPSPSVEAGPSAWKDKEGERARGRSGSASKVGQRSGGSSVVAGEREGAGEARSERSGSASLHPPSEEHTPVSPFDDPPSPPFATTSLPDEAAEPTPAPASRPQSFAASRPGSFASTKAERSDSPSSASGSGSPIPPVPPLPHLPILPTLPRLSMSMSLSFDGSPKRADAEAETVGEADVKAAVPEPIPSASLLFPPATTSKRTSISSKRASSKPNPMRFSQRGSALPPLPPMPTTPPPPTPSPRSAIFSPSSTTLPSATSTTTAGTNFLSPEFASFNNRYASHGSGTLLTQLTTAPPSAYPAPTASPARHQRQTELDRHLNALQQSLALLESKTQAFERLQPHTPAQGAGQGQSSLHRTPTSATLASMRTVATAGSASASPLPSPLDGGMVRDWEKTRRVEEEANAEDLVKLRRQVAKLQGLVDAREHRRQQSVGKEPPPSYRQSE